MAADPFIWALAVKFTHSREEAIAALEVMNSDIGKCAGDPAGSAESRLVAGIARRRLMNLLS